MRFQSKNGKIETKFLLGAVSGQILNNLNLNKLGTLDFLFVPSSEFHPDFSFLWQSFFLRTTDLRRSSHLQFTSGSRPVSCETTSKVLITFCKESSAICHLPVIAAAPISTRGYLEQC